MSDTRFYTVCLLGFAAFVVSALCIMDVAQQPAELNRELVKQIIGIVTPIFAALLIMVNSNANATVNRQRIEAKGEEVKQSLSQKADELVKTANALPKEVKVDAVLHTDKP